MQGTITALKRQQRRRDRVNVFLDGEFAFGLQDILAARLALGEELGEEQVGELLRLEATERAYERVLHFLGYRPRSVAEVRQYLQQKDVSEAASEQVIERLRRARLLGDRAFAEFWVSNRQSHRPKGAWALRSELAAKGVDRDTVAQALEGLDEEGDALRAAERQALKLEQVDDATFRRRLVGFLQRRGFGYDVSRRVTEHYLHVRVRQE
jgi:regulatory protein